MASEEYLAGLIDGEGYIGIIRCSKPGGRESLRIRISCRMTRPEAVALLKERFGGSLRYQENVNARCVGAWEWVCSSMLALRAIEVLEPHLVLKKKQAQVAIEFQREIQTATGRALPAEETYRRRALRAKIIELNCSPTKRAMAT